MSFEIEERWSRLLPPGATAAPEIGAAPPDPGEKSFRSIVVVPSNSDAVDAALLLSSGLETFVAIHGPSGYGKTHLLAAVHQRLRRLHGPSVPPVIDAAEALPGNGLEHTPEPVLIDNAEQCLGRSRIRQRVRLLLERRVRAGKPTLVVFGGENVDRAVRRFLPLHRSWRVEGIGALTPFERERMLQQLASELGLRLGERVLRLLSASVSGGPGTIRGVLTRLLSAQVEWEGPSAVLRACGLLAPMLAVNGAWDVRDHVMHASASAAPLLPEDVRPWEIAAYVMLRVALVPEEQAAGALCTEQGLAYAAAERVAKRLVSCPATLEAVERTVATAVASLAPRRQGVPVQALEELPV